MLERLPLVVQELLFGDKLNFQDVCQVQCTCKALNTTAASNKIWAKLYSALYPEDLTSQIILPNCWKEKVKHRVIAASNWETASYKTLSVNGFHDGQNEQISCLALQETILFAGTRVPQKKGDVQRCFLKIWNLESGVQLYEEVWAQGENMEYKMIHDLQVRGRDLIACSKEGRVKAWTLPNAVFIQSYSGNATCYASASAPIDSALQELVLPTLFQVYLEELHYIGKAYIFNTQTASKNTIQNYHFAVQTEEGWNPWPPQLRDDESENESLNGTRFRGELWILDRQGNVLFKFQHLNCLQGFYVDCDLGMAASIGERRNLQITDLNSNQIVCQIMCTDDLEDFLPLDVFFGGKQLILQALVGGLQTITTWRIGDNNESVMLSKVMFEQGNLDMMSARICSWNSENVYCLLVQSQFEEKVIGVLNLQSGELLAVQPPDYKQQIQSSIKHFSFKQQQQQLTKTQQSLTLESSQQQQTQQIEIQLAESIPQELLGEIEEIEEMEEIEEINGIGTSNNCCYYEYVEGKCQCSWCQMMPSPSIPSPDFPTPECPSPPFFNDLDGGDEEFDIEQLKQMLVDYNIIDEQEAEELGQKANQREQEAILKTRVEMSLRGQFMKSIFHDEVVSVLGLEKKPTIQEQRVEEVQTNPKNTSTILQRGELDLLSAEFIQGKNQQFVVCFGHSRENDIVLWSTRANRLCVMKDVCPVPVRSIKWCPATNWRFLVIASHDPTLGGYLRIVDMLGF